MSQRANAWRAEHREFLRLLVRARAAHTGCEICGYRKDPDALTVLGPTGLPISRLIRDCRRGADVARALREGTVYCANCLSIRRRAHRREHWGVRRG